MVAFLEDRGPWGAEQLIKMATGQLPNAYGMRRQPPANGDTCETNNAFGLSRTHRLGNRIMIWSNLWVRTNMAFPTDNTNRAT